MKGVNDMKCSLKIDHKGAKEISRNTMLFCPLYEKDTGSMVETGVLCAHCCIKSQHVCDALSDLILKQEVIRNDLERNPECFYPYLGDDLRVYAEKVSKTTGKNWLEISRECSRCQPTQVEPAEAPQAEPTKITQVGQNEV